MTLLSSSTLYVRKRLLDGRETFCGAVRYCTVVRRRTRNCFLRSLIAHRSWLFVLSIAAYPPVLSGTLGYERVRHHWRRGKGEKRRRQNENEKELRFNGEKVKFRTLSLAPSNGANGIANYCMAGMPTNGTVIHKQIGKGNWSRLQQRTRAIRTVQIFVNQIYLIRTRSDLETKTLYGGSITGEGSLCVKSVPCG